MKTSRLPRVEPNTPARAGQLASRKTSFGPRSRYAVAAVHTRFSHWSWFVWDAEKPEADGSPSIIRQENTREAAVAGLPLDD